MSQEILSILGCGNLGISIAKGLVQSGRYKPNQIILTKRKIESSQHANELIKSGYIVTDNNIDAVNKSKIIIIAVTPAQLDDLLDSIKGYIDSQIIISCVSGASIDDIKDRLNFNQQSPSNAIIVRAMPNTAIQYCESMTCLAVRSAHSKPQNTKEEKKKDFALETAKGIFDLLGKTFILPEEQIVPATALCACGIAFFCRAIRAASQGGCEIGFHAEDAIFIAAQTAKGAATLLLQNKNHPEFEIDKVTTPQGCTISGLNTMEHCGFSSSIIKGITTSADKAANLYNSKKQQQQNNNNNNNNNNSNNYQQNQQQQNQIPQIIHPLIENLNGSTTTTNTSTNSDNSNDTKSNKNNRQPKKRNNRNQNNEQPINNSTPDNVNKDTTESQKQPQQQDQKQQQTQQQQDQKQQPHQDTQQEQPQQQQDQEPQPDDASNNKFRHIPNHNNRGGQHQYNNGNGSGGNYNRNGNGRYNNRNNNGSDGNGGRYQNYNNNGGGQHQNNGRRFQQPKYYSKTENVTNNQSHPTETTPSTPTPINNEEKSLSKK